MEYRLRVNAGRSAESLSSSSNHHQRSSTFLDKKVQMTTGLGTIDVSLDELNFCLEYDEYAPLWVRSHLSALPFESLSCPLFRELI